MKLTLAKSAAALTIAAAALLAPAAANAATLDYPPTPVTNITNNTVTINFGAGSFAGNETVTIFLAGFNASNASLGFAQAAAGAPVEVGTTVSDAAGGASITITVPNGAGDYLVTGYSDSRPEGVSAAFSFAAAGGSTGTLPATGMDSGSLLGLWVGGGALVLAGGAVAVGATVYRQRKQVA